jgi:hypothetical protein
MIPYIIAGAIGYGVGKVVEHFAEPKKASIPTNKTKFAVFVRTDDFGKNTLDFNSRKMAQAVYDQIAKSGKITYQTVLEYSSFEKKRHAKSKKEGLTKKEHGINNPSDISVVQEVILWVGEEEVDSKTF